MAFVWLVIKFPGFRIAVGVIVVGIVGTIAYWTYSDHRSHLLVKPNELAFSNVRLKRDFGSSYTVIGTIKNNSPHTLTGVALRVTLQDCPKGSCVTIGQDNAEVYSIIPPSQMRTFDGDLYFSDMPTPQAPRWSDKIIQTDAR